MTAKERMQNLLSIIYHPKYLDAKIDPDITWTLSCDHYGSIHKLSTDTIELDPCCKKPNYGEIYK